MWEKYLNCAATCLNAGLGMHIADPDLIDLMSQPPFQHVLMVFLIRVLFIIFYSYTLMNPRSFDPLSDLHILWSIRHLYMVHMQTSTLSYLVFQYDSIENNRQLSELLCSRRPLMRIPIYSMYSWVILMGRVHRQPLVKTQCVLSHSDG